MKRNFVIFMLLTAICTGCSRGETLTEFEPTAENSTGVVSDTEDTASDTDVSYETLDIAEQSLNDSVFLQFQGVSDWKICDYSTGVGTVSVSVPEDFETTGDDMFFSSPKLQLDVSLEESGVVPKDTNFDVSSFVRDMKMTPNSANYLSGKIDINGYEAHAKVGLLDQMGGQTVCNLYITMDDTTVVWVRYAGETIYNDVSTVTENNLKKVLDEVITYLDIK